MFRSSFVAESERWSAVRCIYVLATAACLALPASANAKGGSDVMGLGFNTCAQFAEAYAKSPSIAEILYYGWAQGFLTAANLSTASQYGLDRDFSAKSEADQNAHPLEQYMDAVLQLGMTFPVEHVEKPPK
jgi:hypothetical protein